TVCQRRKAMSFFQKTSPLKTGGARGERDEALAQRGLAVSALWPGDVLEAAVLGRRRREQGEASEEAEVGAADRIDRADAGGGAKDRRKEETQSEARLWQAFWRGRSQSRGAVVGATWQEGGQTEAPASAG